MTLQPWTLHPVVSRHLLGISKPHHVKVGDVWTCRARDIRRDVEILGIGSTPLRAYGSALTYVGLAPSKEF